MLLKHRQLEIKEEQMWKRGQDTDLGMLIREMMTGRAAGQSNVREELVWNRSKGMNLGQTWGYVEGLMSGRPATYVDPLSKKTNMGATQYFWSTY